MGHYVQAFVGARSILELIQRQYGLSRVIDLEQRIALLPLLDDLYDAIPDLEPRGPVEPKFILLTPKIMALLKQTSEGGVIGYFETNYAGGAGGQGAVLARLGEITFGPQYGPGTIDDMLRRLDVSRTNGHDEFDSIGLGRYRDNQDWIEPRKIAQPTQTATLTGNLISWIHGLGKK